MRISPKSLSPADALAIAKANAKANEQTRDDARLEALASEAADEQMPKTSAGEIDARRAHQLLERASSLAGRGEMGAAVLATRQSLALASTNVEGHLLLASLLERSRDFGGARAAYEKAAQLAPERADTRDNLTRLNVYLEKSQGAARQFQFNSDELFAPAAENGQDDNQAHTSDLTESTTSEPKTSEPAESSAPILAVPATAPIAVDSMGIFDESMLPSIEARLPPARHEAPEIPETDGANASEKRLEAPAQSAFMAQSNLAPATAGAAAGATAGVEQSVGERRKNNVPVATERRHSPAVAAPLRPAPLMPAIVSTPAGALSAGALAANSADNVFSLDSGVDSGVDSGIAARTALGVPRAPGVPLNLNLPAAPKAPVWQHVVSRPSFYARTLPVVAVALLSLGFLSWARGRAVSQIVAPASTELAQADLPPAQDATGQTAQTTTGTTVVTAPGAAPGGSAVVGTNVGTDAAGFPISNVPGTFQAPPAQNNAATGNPANGNAATASAPASNGTGASSMTARASNRGQSGGGNRAPRRGLPSPRPVPNFPGVSLAPAPIPPASVRSSLPTTSTAPGNGGIVLPRPSIEMPSAPEPRQRVLPPSDNGLNPAGSPGRGYVRVTEGRVGNGVIPAQPGNVARQNENDANDSARNGQTDQAISQLSQAIRADSDNAGFRYQQRATLFLQRGDYSRASDDFQSAISAYQGQIGRGDDVAQAKRGLSSARSGLNLALAGKRG